MCHFDHRQVEESFKTADVALCRAICNSMSTCSHYTWAPASLACGLRTTPPGGMVSIFLMAPRWLYYNRQSFNAAPKLTQH